MRVESLRMLLGFPVPHLENSVNNTTYLVGLFGGLNELVLPMLA